mgnify:CR=1 FL=1
MAGRENIAPTALHQLRMNDVKCLIVDITKCIGCYNCQLACKDEHVGNDWTPYARPQPEGHFWMKVAEIERGTVPKVKVDWIPKMCMHCEDASCSSACPNGAITRRDDGIVIIAPGKCRGSKKCIHACPYDVIYFNAGLGIAQKCTMCAHLLDRGWKEPRCVSACPANALIFGERADMKDLIASAAPLPLGDKAMPVPKVGVYYIGVPGKFIAGAVYSPTEDKCLNGAEVTLTDAATGAVFSTRTDNYGDFWLEGLSVGTYSLTIQKEGYYPRVIPSISTKIDVNIGDVELLKKV